MDTRARQRKGRHPASAQIPALEWATAAVGALLLAGAIGFMARQAIVSDGEPGPVTFAVTAIRPVGAGFLVEFEARNAGDTTYAELEIEGTLRGASSREERASVKLDFLPGRSSREAGLFFGSDPSRGELELAPKSFRRP